MALVVWQYANPYADLTRCEARDFVVAGQRLTIYQDPAQPISLTANTGCRVWDGAYVLARFLGDRAGDLRGRRVLELGSGTGLAGLAAWVAGAAAVVLTDLPDGLHLLTRNAEANTSAIAASRRETGLLAVGSLRWGATAPELHWQWTGTEPESPPVSDPDPSCLLTQQLISEPYDTILGADVTYLSDALPDLMHTILALSSPATVVYLTHKPRGFVDDILVDTFRRHGFRAEADMETGRDVGYVLYTLTRQHDDTG